MGGDDPKTLEHPNAAVSPEERARRLKVEVERLAQQPPTEWLYYLEQGDIAKKHDVPPATLKEMIETTVRANEKKAREDKAEDRQRIRRVEKDKVTAQREVAREQAKQKREQDQADKEAERKRKERKKAFEAIAQVRRYVVVRDDVAIAVALWTMLAWVHEIAVHSPLLIVRSVEPDSGKTTLLGVFSFLVPRAYFAVELTGANIYYIVDLKKPTLLIDEADQLFRRKAALAEIVNAGWTRGSARIPRMVHGLIHEFDAFCPKVIGMLGLNLPGTMASRAIVCMLWPKLPSEQVADFRHIDDDDFTTLRRKLMRWAADNALLLKDANPVMPPGFSNRVTANWCLLLAIADVAGGLWPAWARAAAVNLSHMRHQPSERLRLLAALQPIFATREQIPSAELVAQLTADPDGEWAEFRGRGPLSQRQVAALLAGFEIFPVVLHPTKRASLSRRGYRRSQFDDAFARFLPQQSEPKQSEHSNTEV